MSVSQITTHVLDTTRGRPASGVAVQLLGLVDGHIDEHGDGSWRQIAAGVTDADGRVTDLGPDSVAAGRYRLRFDTGAYFAALGTDTFFPEVVLTFTVAEGDGHCHVPLLLAPFAYSSYRGS